MAALGERDLLGERDRLEMRLFVSQPGGDLAVTPNHRVGVRFRAAPRLYHFSAITGSCQLLPYYDESYSLCRNIE